AIAILNAALRETEDGDDAARGKIYVALARVYRNIDEFPISRDFAEKALECFRHTGDWRGLTESYLSIGVTDTLEGDYESALANFEQALKLSGDHPAVYLLSKIYYNLAGTYWFLRRPHEGIRYLEKAIGLYERAELKANAAACYNNLGSNLILTGDWARAQSALERALELGREVSGLSGPVLMTLDALGELHMLRGDLEEAREILEEARAHALDKGNKWYASQARRTLGRCYLASGDLERAMIEGEETLALAEKIGDQGGIYESRLLLAEAWLRRGKLESCEAELKRVTDKSVDSIAGLVISGEAQRLSGLLALERGDSLMAVHHFGRSATIFEMLGDRYKSALANYELGRAYAAAEPSRAAEILKQSARVFREMGARLNLRQAEAELSALADKSQADRERNSSLTRLSTLRLTESVASRELLLRELGAVVYQETAARRVLVFEHVEGGQPKAVSAHGSAGDAARLARELTEAQTDRQRNHFATEHDAAVIELRVGGGAQATLLISPREATRLA
ncbi:MAG: tetratricopeptide repeat protein, partial [Acidobacteriota bacterium]|nr:tetratricopeptide repeat protein [Acidobacteriota bacterium]